MCPFVSGIFHSAQCFWASWVFLNVHGDLVFKGMLAESSHKQMNHFSMWLLLPLTSLSCKNGVCILVLSSQACFRGALTPQLLYMWKVWLDSTILHFFFVFFCRIFFPYKSDAINTQITHLIKSKFTMSEEFKWNVNPSIYNFYTHKPNHKYHK